ncbi:MAG: hypothetical protein ACRD72_07460, partial [Candidatus Angelobacter sp.]
MAEMKLAAARERYQARRECGGAWAVIDTRKKNVQVANGLTLQEAEQAADERNFEWKLDLEMKPLEERVAKNRREFQARLAAERQAEEQRAGEQRAAEQLAAKQRLAPLIEAANRHGEFSV